MRRHFGEGSSPILHGDSLVISWDHQGDSFLVALDSADAWARAGFAVTDGRVLIGGTVIILEGPGGARGISSVAIDGVDGRREVERCRVSRVGECLCLA